MNRKYDRPEIKIISKQWVKENCKYITDRDMDLLRTINSHRRRLLRRDQIQGFMPGRFESTDRLNKRLSALYKLHIIDKVYPPAGLNQGSSKQHICIDRAGAILLGLDKLNKPIQVDRKGNRSLPMGWEHKIMLNDYELMLREFTDDKAPNGELLMYEAEEPHPFSDTSLIPDIFWFVKYKGKGYLFFIEVDLGTEDIPYIRRKFDSYRDYYLSKVWVAQKWAKRFKGEPTFPRVLFFTEDGRNRRVESLREYTKESAIRFHVDTHCNARKVIHSILEGS